MVLPFIFDFSAVSCNIKPEQVPQTVSGSKYRFYDADLFRQAREEATLTWIALN